MDRVHQSEAGIQPDDMEQLAAEMIRALSIDPTASATQWLSQMQGIVSEYVLNPSSEADMRRLYAVVDYVLRWQVPNSSRGHQPERDFTEEHDTASYLRSNANTTNETHLLGLQSDIYASASSSSAHNLEMVNLTGSFQSLGSANTRPTSRKLKGIRMDDVLEKKSRASPYKRKAVATDSSSRREQRRYTLNEHHPGLSGGKEFIGRLFRDPNAPVICQWDHGLCQMPITSGQLEDIRTHLETHHRVILTNHDHAQALCKWGTSCNSYVDFLVDHIAWSATGPDHCRFGEYECKMCLRQFTNLRWLKSHVRQEHKGVCRT